MPNTISSTAGNLGDDGGDMGKEERPRSTNKNITSSDAGNKATRQQLQNITNSTVQPREPPTKGSPAVEICRQVRSSGEMGTGNEPEEPMVATSTTSEATKPPPPLMAATGFKRKGTSENKLEVQNHSSGSSKKFKERDLSFPNSSGHIGMRPAVIIVDDGERPSTSRAAREAAEIAARDGTADESAAERRQSTETRCSTETRFSTERRFSVESTDCMESTDEEGSTTSEPELDEVNLLLPEKLLIVLSNSYLNAKERLKLEYPPYCCCDLQYCHEQHYREPLPVAPNFTHAHYLRCALQQQRYLAFIHCCYGMSHRGEYPGPEIFTKLIELVLCLNAKNYNYFVCHFLKKLIELFSYMVRKFPPCWVTVRQFYIIFLQTPLNPERIFIKERNPFKTNSLLEILFNLLENTLELCSPADLQSEDDGFNLRPPEQSNMSSILKASLRLNKLGFDPFVPNENFQDSANSPASEYLSLWEWEAQEARLHTFEALKSTRMCLERVYAALELLLQLLENDMVIWILHHHTKAKEWIFNAQDRPLVVMVFNLSKYGRSTRMVKKLFKLFAISKSKHDIRSHLTILERFISLVMESSNISDLEHNEIGVHYPKVSSGTKSLINEFFQIFKYHNPAHMPSYVETIYMLRIPYVRYEFINNFFKLFYISHSEMMTPKRITNDVFKKRWFKFRTAAEILDDEDLSREEYMQLLLVALQAYCEWHSTKEFFCLLIKNQPIKPLTAVTNSVHSLPVHVNDVVLARMGDRIIELEADVLPRDIMARPTVDLPLIDISIDADLLRQYRSDLKYMMILHELVNSNSSSDSDVFVVDAPVIDFTAWREYLADYKDDI